MTYKAGALAVEHYQHVAHTVDQPRRGDTKVLNNQLVNNNNSRINSTFTIITIITTESVISIRPNLILVGAGP